MILCESNYMDKPDDAYDPSVCPCGCGLPCDNRCPNFVVCGKEQLSTCSMNFHDGLCWKCNMLIGKPLVLQIGIDTECIVCMNEISQAVEWPSCPSKHLYCVDCTKTMHYGRYNVDGKYIDGSIIKCCPLCRTINIPQWQSRRFYNALI
jgi:hypothetical protein